MNENVTMTPEDRAVMAALASAVQNQNELARQALKAKEKSWLGKACDWVEEHPVVVVTSALLLLGAAECYCYMKQKNS
jgi:hypothetical protein